MTVKVGIVAIQGAVSEQMDAVERTLVSLGLKGCAVQVRRLPDLEGVQALILPGGESTTIAKLLVKFGLFDKIIARAHEGMPIMGTCAGTILLAKDGDDQVSKTDTKLLGLMDMAVDRNAFGRQRESFETDIKVEGLKGPFHAVFIRAPAITRVWGKCKVLSRFEDKIVIAKQGNLLALTFHPELTKDLRLHGLLLQMI
jgi:pyridoxal 5'-phosphate synthase pdxT subunit